MMSWMDSVLLIFSTLILGVSSVDFGELKAMGLDCPERNRCAGYSNNRTLLSRGCECDPDCTVYRDCCIDAEGGSSPPRSDMECMQIGHLELQGVHMVAKCDDEWTGPTEVRQKCEGPTDYSDPASLPPLTNPARRITYKNVHCAECNRAEKESLEPFRYEYACRGLGVRAPQEEIMKHLTYNRTMKKWGVNVWWDDDEEPTFEECQAVFHVPPHLNEKVRFCRANIVSDCSRRWTDAAVRKSCHEYTSVVYDRTGGYRNPHCAICNNRSTSNLSCPGKTRGQGYGIKGFMLPGPIMIGGKLFVSFLDGTIIEYKCRFSFAKLLQIRYSSGSCMPTCSRGEIFDPYFKKCRKLRCALPGYVIRNGTCVKGD